MNDCDKRLSECLCYLYKTLYIYIIEEKNKTMQ